MNRDIEITHISANGVWLNVRNDELFLSYRDFPWFLDHPLKSILNVTETAPGHFHWPDMDVDLTVEMICHPERFPLLAKS